MDDCEKEVCDFHLNKVIVDSLYFWGDRDTKEQCALDLRNTKPKEHYDPRDWWSNPTGIVWFDNRKCFYSHRLSMAPYRKKYGKRHWDRPFWFADPFLDIHDFKPKFLTEKVKSTWACFLSDNGVISVDPYWDSVV